jgi:hypothetical protein
MSISPPTHSADHSDRGIDCEFAIEPVFQQVVRDAMAAGWTGDEVSSAMIQLALNHLDGELADRTTQVDIEAAARSIA